MPWVFKKISLLVNCISTRTQVKEGKKVKKQQQESTKKCGIIWQHNFFLSCQVFLRQSEEDHKIYTPYELKEVLLAGGSDFAGHGLYINRDGN